MDLGLSSAQLDDRKRGISFKNRESPLDMSFSGSSSSTEHIINSYSYKDLAMTIKLYGEERFASRIAKNITHAREIKPISTVGELIDIVVSSIPKKFQTKGIHPATKTFQALRIVTNDELDSLKQALSATLQVLKKGGRLIVVLYHSLEDRIVKTFFKTNAVSCICPAEIPICMCNNEPNLKIITKKPIIPKDNEIITNPRSRSAKLRAAEKI